MFNFLDWRSKLALARCNRTLLGDADSPLSWQYNDSLSSFHRGVIELNLALLPNEQTIRLVLRSLAARRGRVHLSYRHSASNRCLHSSQKHSTRSSALLDYCRSCTVSVLCATAAVRTASRRRPSYSLSPLN